MVGVDPVRGEVLESGQSAKIRQRRRVVEQELVRYWPRRFLLTDRQVGISLEITAAVFCAELDALSDPLVIIEGAEHERLAELPVINEVPCDLVVGVKA